MFKIQPGEEAMDTRNTKTDTARATNTSSTTTILHVTGSTTPKLDPKKLFTSTNPTDFAAQSDAAKYFYFNITPKDEKHMSKEELAFLAKCTKEIIPAGNHQVCVRTFGSPTATIKYLFLHGFSGTGSDSYRLMSAACEGDKQYPDDKKDDTQDKKSDTANKDAYKGNKDIQCIFIDMPGHGESTSKDQKIDVRAFVDAIKETSRRYGPFKMVSAHSLGAVALTKALADEQVVSSQNPEEPKHTNINMSEVLPDGSMQSPILVYLAASSSYDVTLEAASKYFKAAPMEKLSRVLQQLVADHFKESYAEVRKQYSNALNLAQIKHKIPRCAIFHGTADTLYPAEEADKLYASIKENHPETVVTKHILEGLNHGNILLRKEPRTSFLELCKEIASPDNAVEISPQDSNTAEPNTSRVTSRL